MMYHYPHFMGMGSGWLSILLSLLLTAIILVGVVAWWPSRAERGESADTGAEKILDERFARGEIDAEEYEQRRHILHAAHR
ncbi:SHOCT domain-containing protein [Actinoplanes sp. NPDC020271]|uniref:SHOCT domain-containing protein n=1 Tax=Actinoplanes sp. NPDC020271 TaxID=3363896 RepID=UPI0037A7825B